MGSIYVSTLLRSLIIVSDPRLAYFDDLWFRLEAFRGSKLAAKTQAASAPATSEPLVALLL